MCICCPSGRSSAPGPITEPPLTPAPAPLGATLEYFAGAVDWFDAEIVCVSAGGHLASVHSQEQNDALVAFVASQDSAQANVWLGLHDRDVEVGLNFLEYVYLFVFSS